MTVARVTQEFVDVLREAVTPAARVTNLYADVLREAATPAARVTSLYVDVLRGGAIANVKVFPVRQSNRVWFAGTGTRIFPV